MNARRPHTVGLRPQGLLAGLLCLALTVPAVAQERSDTGRRRLAEPAQPESKPEPEGPAPMFTAGGERWLVGLGLGSLDGGDLFRVETAGGQVVPWGEIGREEFRASRFTASLDPGLAITAFGARRLGGGRWWLRGELSRGSCDLAARALLGQGGEVFLYDRLTVFTATLAAEARLSAWPSHPYGALGLTLSHLAADEVADLGRTLAGVQATLGYRHRIGRGFVAVEGRLGRMTMDLNDFRPTVALVSQPELVYGPADELWLFEMRLFGSRTW